MSRRAPRYERPSAAEAITAGLLFAACAFLFWLMSVLKAVTPTS